MAEFDQILPITEVKKDLLHLVKAIGELKQSIAITKLGKPAAVLLSIDEYEGLLETLEIMSDPKLVKRIKRSLKDLDSGRFLTHDEVWGA